jgi:hypothetical protein
LLLDSYGDGEYMEEDGEEEEGDDELEKIEEEVFDGSQPPSLPKKRKKRMTNYTEIEDTCWCGHGRV